MIDSQVASEQQIPQPAGGSEKLTRFCWLRSPTSAMVTPRSTQYPTACLHPPEKPQQQLPEVIVHRFEEKLVIWLLEDILEVRQSDFVRRHGQLHQIRRLLVVEVVDNFGLPHLALRLEARRARCIKPNGLARLPLGPRLPVALGAVVPRSSRLSVADRHAAQSCSSPLSTQTR